MGREKRASIAKLAAWKKRTGTLFRKDDAGGRKTPESVMAYGRRKPYEGLMTHSTSAKEISKGEQTGKTEAGEDTGDKG